MSDDPTTDSTALAEHLALEESLFYVRDLVSRPERVPEEFDGESISRDGPPWRTIVHGLETDAFQMRARFERFARSADARGQAWLSHLLLASYSGKYGYREGGTHRMGFEEWAKGLTPPRKLEMFPLNTLKAAPSSMDGGEGCAVLALRNAPGHVPVGHDYLLYRLAELTPFLADAFFAEESHLDNMSEGEARETPKHGAPSYRIKVWCRGQFFEGGARFYGERYDVDSAISVLNSTLRALGETTRFVEFTEGRIACGNPAQLAARSNIDAY